MEVIREPEEETVGARTLAFHMVRSKGIYACHTPITGLLKRIVKSNWILIK